MKRRFGILLALLVMSSSASAGEFANVDFPIGFRFQAGEPWLVDVGEADTPLKAFVTFDMCYHLWQPRYCDAVGLGEQAFSELPRPLQDVGSDPKERTTLWIYAGRILSAADIAVMDGAKDWAQAGFAELKIGYSYCGKGGVDEPTNCDEPRPAFDESQYHMTAYLKPVGSNWHLAGWISGTGNAECELDNPEAANYRMDCDLMIDDNEYVQAMSKRK